MKRFLGLAVAAVFAGALWAQVWAVACTYEGATHCQFGAKGCYDVTTEYSSISKLNCGDIRPAPDGGGYPRACTCDELIDNCLENGQWYKGATFTSSAANNWGGDVVCSDVGGTPVGEVKQEYGCCNWSTEGSKCFAVTDPTKVDACKSGSNTYWTASCGDNLPDESRACPTSEPTYNGKEAACSGKWCYWDANEETGGAAGCFQVVASATETCTEAINSCESYSPRKQTYDSEAACNAGGSGVRFVGSKAATPGLKVSYAKNRVTVNWTPTAKVSSGTIQLLNAKGVALSTSYIKANSGKVTAKLATVGVPAGMYFVHISAVGVNGQKIVTQSAVSIVK